MGVLDLVGNTPLLKLERVFSDLDLSLFVKLESFNPGGSIKDRTALYLLKNAFEQGLLNESSVVIESSSGNMGIGLAQACRIYRMRFICVVDPKATEQNIAILRAYGAEIVRVEKPDPETGEYLPARIKRVNELLTEIPNSFWTNQYANPFNWRAHYEGTVREIVESLGKAPDYLLCGTSTCGTLMGCARYLREQKFNTCVVAVDAVGSKLFGGKSSPRLLPGLGAAYIPPILDRSFVDLCVQVTDFESVIGCRLLVNREAILVGGSSGGLLMAIKKVVPSIPPGSTCVMIFPDRGERYLDTIFNDSWVARHFGEVDHCLYNGD